eukprot:10913752-Alexandrium_andersonii.AAC.1
MPHSCRPHDTECSSMTKGNTTLQVKMTQVCQKTVDAHKTCIQTPADNVARTRRCACSAAQ